MRTLKYLSAGALLCCISAANAADTHEATVTIMHSDGSVTTSTTASCGNCTFSGYIPPCKPGQYLGGCITGPTGVLLHREIIYGFASPAACQAYVVQNRSVGGTGGCI